MYYEEQIINGELYYRTSPDGRWNYMSREMLNEKLIDAKEEIKILQSRLSMYEELKE
jgi:hypothetical protein